MLIRDAELWGHGHGDLRIAEGRIAALGRLMPGPGEPVIEARGGLLLPGLHDHHIHLAGLAARAASLPCGPPEVNDPQQLADRLAGAPGEGWIRAIGYHESVMGLPDAAALDRLVPGRPLRLQHRSGRMWLLNSAALAALLETSAPPPGLERAAGRFTGRLFDEDAWLAAALGAAPPDLADVSAQLAARGVTGVTDLSPRNAAAMARHTAAQIAGGRLLQRCTLGGTLALAELEPEGWRLGPAKLHLHEAALPDFDEAAGFIAAAHGQGRIVAIHCVSETELVFALALLETAGSRPSDRIEHASVAAPALVARIAGLDLAVCVQPHFVTERGDRYLADVAERDQPHLYRLRSLAAAAIPLAGGSDAPFASADPWLAMAAAVSRRTREGQAIGPDEALSPEAALALYLADPDDFGAQRALRAGAPADLCLLRQPWSELRANLAAVDVAATLVSGRIVHDRIDQPPA